MMDVKTYYWSFDETENDELDFYVSGITEQQETVMVKIVGFTPYLYLELPKEYNWTSEKCRKLFNYFGETLKRKKPIEFSMEKKYLLANKRLVKTMYMAFKTQSHARNFKDRCMKDNMYVPQVGSFPAGKFKVHEHNIDPIIKFTAWKGIKLAGWIRVKPMENEDDEHYSTTKHNLIAHWTDVEAIADKECVMKPKYISFDGEMNSVNHNSKIPDANIPGNEIFHMANAVGRINDGLHNVRLVLFTKYDPHDIKQLYLIDPKDDDKGIRTNNITIVRCKTEKELILKWVKFIQEEDPDLFIGYNIMKFDWDYVITRCEVLGIYNQVSSLLSRIFGMKAQVKKQDWSSSAYKKQVFRYYESHRTNMDVLIEVERNYKLPLYNLNTVSDFFLKEQKDDVTAPELFMMYKLTEDYYERMNDKRPFTTEEVDELKKYVRKNIIQRKVHADVKEYRDELLEAKPENMRSLLRKAMYITGKYALKDVILPIRLADKLKLWTSMEAMSNIMHIPMSYLHTRGQQIRVLAQVYRETIKDSVVIPFNEKQDTEQYQGAMVVDAVPGDYEYVSCLDFASLYPSMMIAYNICHTTLVEDNSVPDSECHVLEWEDHIRCEHDPQKKARGKGNILCKKHRHRFRKVVMHPDGSREYEGIMPRLERMLLSERKVVKKEMAKCEATLKMHEGNADSDDMAFYKKMGWEIIEEGSLTESQAEILSVNISVLNAQQLAIKVSCNSVGGYTPIPCQVNGVFKYLTIEELSNGEWVEDEDGNQVSQAKENILVWSDCGFTDIKHVIRHKIKTPLKRVITHTGLVDCTKEHSLLRTTGEEVKPAELELGEKLMHRESPLPIDTPEEPLFRTISDKTIQDYNLSSDGDGITPEYAFVLGLFFAEGTCGVYRYNSKKGLDCRSSWAIYNLDYDLLERARIILEKYEGMKFFIELYDTATTYYLKPYANYEQGVITALCKKYRNMFYDKRKYKVVPHDILTSSLEVRQAYFMGYYAGDGARKKDIGVVVLNSGQRGSAQLMYLLRSLGYKVSVSCSDTDIIRLQACTKFRIVNTEGVKKILDACNQREVRDNSWERNGQKIIFENQKAEYKGITIKCERFPRQKLLDSLDNAQIKLAKIGRIVEYNTKYKKLTYKCDECEKMAIVRLGTVHKCSLTKQNICQCKNKYTGEGNQACYDDNEYIYDIETVSHHFAAGVGNMIVHNSGYGSLGARTGFIPFITGAGSVTAMGRKSILAAIKYIKDTWPFVKLVYGDTDSCMMHFQGATREESFEYAKAASFRTSNYLRCELNGVKEDHQLMCNDNKMRLIADIKPEHLQGMNDEDRILYYKYNATPITLEFENMYGRFFLLSKKRYVAYRMNRDGKIEGKTKKGVVLARRDNCKYLRDTYDNMVTAILDNKDEGVIQNILYSRIDDLFQRKIIDHNLVITIGINSVIDYAKKKEVKNQAGDVIGKYYLDCYGERIDGEVTDPRDPRLVYRNLPQALVCKKMLDRGEEIPSNIRLEIIYLENEEAQHQGEKAEEYNYFKMNRNEFKVDYIHYIEKQLANPVTELLEVKYPKKDIPYLKLEDEFRRAINNLGHEVLKERILRCRGLPKMLKFVLDGIHKHRIEMEKKEINLNDLKYGKKNKISVERYIPKGELDNVINPNDYSELVRSAFRLNSRLILDKACASRGISKIPTHKPNQYGEKIKEGTAIMLMEEMKASGKKIYPRFAYGKVEKMYESENNKKKHYTYDIKMDGDGHIFRNLKREHFTTFYTPYKYLFKDIIAARKIYKNVVSDLDKLFETKIVYENIE
jgi:DNA polymerase elongation subunit (family B)